MLVIRDDHVDNHFSDKFVPICHVGYFFNGNRQVNSRIYLLHFFHFRELNFVFLSLKNAFVSELHI